MLVEDALETGLDRCFDAVVQPDRWPAAMGALAQALGASGACFNSSSAAADRHKLPASIRYRDMLSEFVADGWVGQDLRARRGWNMIGAGRSIVLEDDVTTAEERARSPIYAELFARHEMEMCAGVCMEVGGQVWSLTLVRSAADGGFARDDVDLMVRAQPSLRRLLQFSTEISLSSDRGAMAVLDGMALAAAILDQRGRVVRINAAAEALLGHGLELRSGRLTATDQTSNAALAALMGAAGAQREAVCIRRPDRDPLIVEAIALKNVRADAFGMAGTLLLITDTAARATPALTLLQRAFGLTGREAIVARHLAKGETTADIAGQLDLRQSTVRQVVKSVLDKTETRRQGALVAKLSRLPKER